MNPLTDRWIAPAHPSIAVRLPRDAPPYPLRVFTAYSWCDVVPVADVLAPALVQPDAACALVTCTLHESFVAPEAPTESFAIEASVVIDPARQVLGVLSAIRFGRDHHAQPLPPSAVDLIPPGLPYPIQCPAGFVAPDGTLHTCVPGGHYALALKLSGLAPGADACHALQQRGWVTVGTDGTIHPAAVPVTEAQLTQLWDMADQFANREDYRMALTDALCALERPALVERTA